MDGCMYFRTYLCILHIRCRYLVRSMMISITKIRYRISKISAVVVAGWSRFRGPLFEQPVRMYVDGDLDVVPKSESGKWMDVCIVCTCM